MGIRTHATVGAEEEIYGRLLPASAGGADASWASRTSSQEEILVTKWGDQGQTKPTRKN